MSEKKSVFDFRCDCCGIYTNHPFQFIGALWCEECYNKEPDRLSRQIEYSFGGTR